MLLPHNPVRAFRDVAALALYATGIGWIATFVRRRLARSYRIFVVSYHHVVRPEERPHGADETTTVQFARHLEFFTRSFAIVSLEKALDLLDRGELTRDYLVVTFDDGYADNYREALPILRRFGVPATIFLISGLVGTDQVPRHDARRARVAGASHFAVLSWTQVREMARYGISFGSHTVDHPNLTELQASAIREQLESSKRDIEEATKTRCEALAFPYGYFDAAVVAAAKEAGYRCACTQGLGSNRPGCDRFRLYRVALGDTPLHVVAVKLSGAMAPWFAAREGWRRWRWPEPKEAL